MMVYIGNTIHIYKIQKKSNFILIPGVQTSIFHIFYEKIWKSKNRSQKVSAWPGKEALRYLRRVADRYSARSARMRATSGQSSWPEALYVAQLLRYYSQASPGASSRAGRPILC